MVPSRNGISRLASPLAVDIWEGIRSRPGRFGLSLFSMSIGMAVLTTLIALLAGLETRAQQLSLQLGTNVIAVLPNATAGHQRLGARHASLLRQNYPQADISGLRRASATTAGTDRSLSVVGVEEPFFRIRQWPLRSGRFFDSDDMRMQRRYAVVSQSLMRDWNWAVGSTILLRDVPFLVVGVVGSDSASHDREIGDARLTTGDRVVYVPLSVAAHVESRAAQDEHIDALFFRPAGQQAAAGVLPGLQNLLAQPDLGLGNLSWVIPESLIRNVKRMQGTVGVSVGAIALLSLVLGGTTLSSLLVTNVRERVAEIGLRRAVGATEADIAVLFVAEGCVATLSAAVIGSLLVHGLIAADLQIFARFPLEAGAYSLVLPLVLSVFLGVAFSCWPALSAARIIPSQALRAD